MKEFDPQVAARVWQRVQASAGRAEEKPVCPIEGIRTVPAVWEKPEKTQKPVCAKACGTGTSEWLFLVLVIALLQIR